MGRDCCGGYDDAFEDETPHSHENQHPDHSKELSRLNRAVGQIEGVKRMIEERRYCPEIITQLRAARAALKSLEANILETHLGHCISDTLNTRDTNDVKQKIKELQDIFKRFD